MSFEEALKHLKNGYTLFRKGWKTTRSFVYLVNSTKVNYENLRGEAARHLQADDHMNKGRRAKINGHIDMKCDDGTILVGWTPTQVDLLSEDWEVVDSRSGSKW